MSLKYLNLSGLEDLWINIKNYILSKVPTKTSELINDSGYLTSHQSLDNYVTIDTAQDIEGNKNFKGLLTTIPDGTIWPVTASTTDDITYLGANAIHVEQKGSGKLTDLSGGAWTVAELGVGCFFFRINNGADIRYKNFAQNTVNRIPVVSGANRFINDVTPNENNTYSLGTSSLRWKECYSNVYYLGTTAFGDIVTHNASEFLTSHQSLSNYVTLDSEQTISGNKTFTGTLTGTLTGNCSGSSSSCTGNAATATTATKVVGTVANNNTGALVQGIMGTNDCFRIAIGGASNAGWAEIATGDDYNEPIYVRQYQGAFTTLKRTATLLDASGNTSFPGTVTATGFSGPLTGNVTGNCSGSSASCTGNASSATEFSAKKSVTLTGDVTGTASSKAGWSVATTLANSGVTAGTYGPSADVTGNNNATISVPQITVDAKGRVTSVTNRTYTSVNTDTNTDTKVTQTVTTANSNYPVLLCATANATTTGTTTSRFSEGLAVNARYSSISMTNKYDTANTKGVRDSTKGYLNGDIIFKCYDASEMGRIHCESSKNGYQQTYMQARSYIKNGAISPEGTATTCYITVRVRDNGSKTIYTDGSWENSLTPYINETYDLGTPSLRWMRCYCKNFYGSYVDIAGRYLENEYSTNARTCLYLKSNRDTDGQSGIYFSKFRQNRAQGSLTGSDLVDLSLDVLENSVRTNSCISISFRYFENDVPTKIYFIPKKSMTSYMGTEANPWTNAYITNLNLNGNSFDPTSIDGVGTTRLLAYEPASASDYGSSPAGTTKPGSSLYDVSMHLSNATGYYGDFNSGSGKFSVTVNAHEPQSGTWKVLHNISVSAPQSGTRSFVISMWVRIA